MTMTPTTIYDGEFCSGIKIFKKSYSFGITKNTFKTILNTYQSSAVSYKNQLCRAKQMTGFYKKRYTELNWVKGKDKLEKTLTIEVGKAAHP